MIIFSAIKKIILGGILVVGIAVVVLIVVGVIGYFYHPNDPPSVQDAPWAVRTSSRVYYAKEITSVNGVPAITNYWYSDGGQWYFVGDVKPKNMVETPTAKLVDGKWSLIFDKKLYPEVAIIRRSI